MSSITRSILHVNFSSTQRTPSSRTPRSESFFFNPICYMPIQNHKHESSYLADPSFQYLVGQNVRKAKRNMVVYSNIPPEFPISSGGLPGGIPGSWKGWLLGMVFTVIIPLVTNKWGALSNWTKKIGATIQSVENIVEAVEGMAEKVEKMAEDVLDDLPEGTLKTALSRVERVAEHVAQDAKKIDDMIDKVQEVEDKLQNYIEEEEQKEALKKGTNEKQK